VDSSGVLYICDSNNNRVRRVTTDGAISTIAGGAQQVSSGNEGRATSAQLNHPSAIALGADGSIYVAEEFGNRVRRITPDGVIHAFAGSGGAGYRGDGGPAIAALLTRPSGLAAGSDGTVYIADTGNHVIRAVYADGSIGTIAGIGGGGYAGDGGTAAVAALNGPAALALDSAGNMYVADAGNGRVRVITTDGNIDTIAGALAPAIFTDSIFNGGDYSQISSDAPSGATATVNANGNGTLSVQYQQSGSASGNANFIALNQNWNYDPAILGPASTIDIAATMTGCGQWKVVLSQGGKLYAALPSAIDTAAGAGGRQYVVGDTGLTASSFEGFTVLRDAYNQAQNPDFTKPFSLGFGNGVGLVPTSSPATYVCTFNSVGIVVNRAGM
jgi:sugar lactone lactonase YvrE